MTENGKRKHQHDVFSMWQRSMEQGFDTWGTLLGQPQNVDLLQFWMLLFMRGLQTWTQVVQEGGSVPEAMAQWKKFMDDSMEQWSTVLHGAMDTDAFAAFSGRLLDQYLHAAAPMRAAMQSGTEDVYRTMNLPSRKQVTSLASQIVAIDARLEAMEDRLGELVGSLKALEAAVKQPADRPPRPGPQARPAKPGRNASRRRQA